MKTVDQGAGLGMAYAQGNSMPTCTFLSTVQ